MKRKVMTTCLTSDSQALILAKLNKSVYRHFGVFHSIVCKIIISQSDSFQALCEVSGINIYCSKQTLGTAIYSVNIFPTESSICCLVLFIRK